MCDYDPPERISSDTPNFEYKVIYAVGRIGWIKGLVHRRGAEVAEKDSIYPTPQFAGLDK